MEKANINYPLAIILGLIFGIIGGIIWFGVVVLTKWQFGLIAVIAGYLSGLGVYLGSGKKKGVNLQIISCLLAFISIMIGEYLITNHFTYKYLIEQGYQVTGYLLSPIKIMPIVFTSLKDDPLTLLFWGIAVYAAFFITKPVKLRKI